MIIFFGQRVGRSIHGRRGLSNGVVGKALEPVSGPPAVLGSLPGLPGPATLWRISLLLPASKNGRGRSVVRATWVWCHKLIEDLPSPATQRHYVCMEPHSPPRQSSMYLDSSTPLPPVVDVFIAVQCNDYTNKMPENMLENYVLLSYMSCCVRLLSSKFIVWRKFHSSHLLSPIRKHLFSKLAGLWRFFFNISGVSFLFGSNATLWNIW